MEQTFVRLLLNPAFLQGLNILIKLSIGECYYSI